MDRLLSYNWPGNVRELENAIERCVVINPRDTIEIQDLPPGIVAYKGSGNEFLGNVKLEEAIDNTEKNVIIKTLGECDGNRTKASILLGISRRSLHRKILKYNIED